MKKNILSFMKNTYTKYFVLGLALSFIIAFSVQSVIASGQTLKFIPDQSGLINKIGSLTIGSDTPATWIDPNSSNAKNNGLDCMTSRPGTEKETCLDVAGTGSFSKLMVLGMHAFITDTLFLNNDGDVSTVSGLPGGLILEDTGSNDSIMATGLQRNDDSGNFAPVNTTDMRPLCADNAGTLYPCEISDPVETYHWDIGDWGACSTTSGGSGTGVGSSGPYSSCFIANTKVSMADGTIKNIQEVKIGDILKGQKTNNTVLGFHQPKLGDKKLYSFNGGKYFVTAEHPFMTTEGWKAFNPELAQKEHHLNIKIGQLALGDTLVTEKGNIVLKTVDTKSDKADTQLYNFILDGDHTYYADGYLVHNKIVCANNDANCGYSNSICYNSSDGLVDMSNLHNDICSNICITPGSTAVVGGCDYNSTQTEAYCGEDLRVHCRVPVSNSTGKNGGISLDSTSVATRTVVCKNSSNDTVDDSFCPLPKPPVRSDDPSLEGGNFCS